MDRRPGQYIQSYADLKNIHWNQKPGEEPFLDWAGSEDDLVRHQVCNALGAHFKMAEFGGVAVEQPEGKAVEKMVEDALLQMRFEKLLLKHWQRRVGEKVINPEPGEGGFPRVVEAGKQVTEFWTEPLIT